MVSRKKKVTSHDKKHLDGNGAAAAWRYFIVCGFALPLLYGSELVLNTFVSQQDQKKRDAVSKKRWSEKTNLNTEPIN